MKNFFEDYIMYVLVIIVGIVVIFVLVVAINNNQSTNIDDTHFTWAIIPLSNGELIEGEVTSLHNFNDSHMIQVTINDNLTMLTHSSNVLLFDHEP